MPEGDTILQYAARLRPLLEGRALQGAECRWPDQIRGLAGRTVTALDTVGKHLLVAFDDDTVLRVHLGMKGSWHRYGPGERWRRSRGELAVALYTETDQVVCFFAPDVERIEVRALPVHPVLAALGPDLARPGFDAEEVARRVARFEGSSAELLLAQRVACGLGNVYKSELLFAHRLWPEAPAASVDADTWRRVYAQGGAWLHENASRTGRNTTGRRSPALWVYGRGGRPCLSCGSRVRSSTDPGPHRRVTYRCPQCQVAP